jgi:outer membrane receptor for ferrienterochelin and colicins
MSKNKISIIIFISLLLYHFSIAQPGIIKGVVTANGVPLPWATVTLLPGKQNTTTSDSGTFILDNVTLVSRSTLVISAVNYATTSVSVNDTLLLNNITINMQPLANTMDEVVVSGTLKPVIRSQSPVPVEIYTPQFFKKNPAPSIFESLQNVNGVRPQINCNVCNTGDIHINGLEGPYTMVTIDGMPIVSSLSTVYGLFGIPAQLIERVEIVKGPASGLYGSEAVGGLINIITKNPVKAPLFTADVMTTSWSEHNIDLGAKINAGKTKAIAGVNYFNYAKQQDKNNDGFTDVTNQHRISVFNKWSFNRKENKLFTLAGRYFYEDRWGGDVRWNKNFRGGDSIYAESIYTSRFELLGKYQLPFTTPLMLSFSYNNHSQNSFYGTTSFMANQQIAFSQLTWDKNFNRHNLLAGAALRYTLYDDNTTATLLNGGAKNNASKTFLPGVFLQDEWKLNEKQQLLMGLRYDHHSEHGNIFTPRIAFKHKLSSNNMVRINAGTGFRVVNIFTEDHAALTGARTVAVTEALKPERSYNVNVNYTTTVALNNSFINIESTAWFTYFSNQIMADYDTDANKIFYRNLDGYATTKGASVNIDYNLANRLKLLLGATVQQVKRTETINGVKRTFIPVLVENWSGNWAITYTLPKQNISIDYTGNVTGPMRLPLLGALDPRRPYSPVWSVQNIQITKKTGKIELYGGVKNLLNMTPARNNPFLIARSNDPFDKNVQYDTDGKVLATPGNPYALTFDPNYVFAPNQGIRFFLGCRIVIDK